MRDTSTLLPSAGRLSRSRRAVAFRGGGRFCASPPQVRKSLRLRYGAVTSENGTPGDGSTGRGTGPAPRRTAKRQPAGTLSQARAAARPRAAKTAPADRDQGNAVASESEVRPAAADGTDPAASASGPPAAGPRPTAPGPGARSKTAAATSRSGTGATSGSGTTGSARSKATPAARSGSTAHPAEAATRPAERSAAERSGAKRSAGTASQHDAAHGTGRAPGIATPGMKPPRAPDTDPPARHRMRDPTHLSHRPRQPPPHRKHPQPLPRR